MSASIPGSKVIKRIPITLLTGFLGSGKTTLLRQMLTAPEWHDTAVLINELGEVGLDHHLLWGASDAVMVMENGCICCSVRDDLATVLEDLFWRRLQRQVPYFSRVVIETTGLADPGPVAALLRSHALIAERYALDNVLCTADAVLGALHLARHRESVAQAASADAIVVTKTDLASEQAIDALEAMLRSINPMAALSRTGTGQFTPALLQAHGGTPATPPADGVAGGHLYHHRVRTVSLRFSRPWERAQFEHALSVTLATHGARILRIKGLVAVIGEDVPMVVQAVQETMFPLERLPAWPGKKRDSFIVCITMGLADDAIAAAFRSHLDVPI
jgi:G3E family GTPase